MDKITLIAQIKTAVDEMSKTKLDGIYYWYLGTDNNDNDYAIVLGWGCGFDINDIDEYSDGEYRLCLKLATQPGNSMLQCDYNIDWSMPYCDNGDINDTEIPIYNTTNLNIEINWLLNQFKLYECEW